ncbi:restriction endonuclease [Micrococcus sp.]|uniref:restriction endonuclease n=1 Tax=Micrococcus sp. TaxID=1271 RepID=UPI002A90E682|nr:restriction endonuclease [Micrococcus sp.]MDY6054765.1 restriction endonuclease [Micrococcus sp.]
MSAAADEPQVPASIATEETAAADPIVDHEELAQDAISGMNELVRADLLRRLQDATPEFFEDAVVKLLVAMGYGGTQGRAQVTGKSHDGGIDGDALSYAAGPPGGPRGRPQVDAAHAQAPGRSPSAEGAGDPGGG